jgi:hypothetical protein
MVFDESLESETIKDIFENGSSRHPEYECDYNELVKEQV